MVWQRPLPLAREKGTNHHLQAPVWMDAGIGMVLADDLRQGQSKEELLPWRSGQVLPPGRAAQAPAEQFRKQASTCSPVSPALLLLSCGEGQTRD